MPIARCGCGSSDRSLVSAAKLFEQERQIVVIRDVPFLECRACGEKELLPEIIEQLDVQVMRLFKAGASFVVADWLGN